MEEDFGIKRLCGTRAGEENKLSLWLIVAFLVVFCHQEGLFGPKTWFLEFNFSLNFNLNYKTNFPLESLLSFDCLDPEEFVILIVLGSERVPILSREGHQTEWTSQHVIYNAVCGSFGAFLIQRSHHDEHQV